MFKYLESGSECRGALEFADYCPYYTVYSKNLRETKCNVPTTHIFDDFDDKARRSRKGQLNIYSKTSKCFNLVKEPKIKTIEDGGNQYVSTTSGTLLGLLERME